MTGRPRPQDHVRVRHGRDREAITTDAERESGSRGLIGTEARREATLRAIVGLEAVAEPVVRAAGDADDDHDTHDAGAQTVEAMREAGHAARRAAGLRRRTTSQPGAQAPGATGAAGTTGSTNADAGAAMRGQAVTDEAAEAADTSMTTTKAKRKTTSKPKAKATTAGTATTTTTPVTATAAAGTSEGTTEQSEAEGAGSPQGTARPRPKGHTDAQASGTTQTAGVDADGGAGSRSGSEQANATGRPLSASPRPGASTPEATATDGTHVRATNGTLDRTDDYTHDRTNTPADANAEHADSAGYATSADTGPAHGPDLRDAAPAQPARLSKATHRGQGPEIRVETTRASRAQRRGRQRLQRNQRFQRAQRLRRLGSARTRPHRTGVTVAMGSRGGTAAAGRGATLAVALPVAVVATTLVATFFMLLSLVAGGVADEDRTRGAAMVADVATEAYETGANRGDYHWKGETFRDYVGGTTDRWDAAFCSWCLGQAGFVESGLVGRYASVDSFLARFESDPATGEVHGPTDTSYVPEVGDLVVLGIGTQRSRIAIVTDVAPDASRVTCVEGDSAGGEAGSYDLDADGFGGYVAAIERVAHDGSCAYLHPNYSAEAADAAKAANPSNASAATAGQGRAPGARQ